MKDDDRAFPGRSRWDSANNNFDLVDSGMTLLQYAAIHLKVPMSGDPEIDAMIRESRKLEAAEKAVANLLIMGSASWEADVEGVVKMAFRVSDAMLEEWEKEEQ
jgi:hypothetical protein